MRCSGDCSMAERLIWPRKVTVSPWTISLPNPPDKDLGDYQTPLPLAREIVAFMAAKGRHWNRILEPTCGKGNFIRGIFDIPLNAIEIQGIELQEKHFQQAQSVIQRYCPSTIQTTLHRADIFDMDLKRDLKWASDGSLLVIGNPP